MIRSCENNTTVIDCNINPRAKKCLMLAMKAAEASGTNYIGSDHILIGLIREESGMASMFLKEHGITEEGVCEFFNIKTVDQMLEYNERKELARLKAKYEGL